MPRQRKPKKPLLSPEEKLKVLRAGALRGVLQRKINRYGEVAAKAGLTVEEYFEKVKGAAGLIKTAAAERTRQRKERIARDQAIADMLEINRSYYTGERFKASRLGRIEAEQGIEGLRRDKERRVKEAARLAAAKIAAPTLRAEAQAAGLSYLSWRRFSPAERRRRLEAAGKGEPKGKPLPTATDHRLR